MVSIGLGAEVRFHEGDDVIDHLVAEALVHVRSFGGGRVRSAGHHVAVGHGDNHRFRFALRDEIVQDEMNASYLEPCFLRIGGTANEVENRVGCIAARISRRGVNEQRAIGPEGFRKVSAVLDFPVGHVLPLVKTRFFTWDVYQTAFEAFVGKEIWVVWICNRDPIDNEAVWVKIWLDGPDGRLPYVTIPLR